MNNKIAVFASGTGSNFRSLIENKERYGYVIDCLVTNKVCKAQEIAQENGIEFLQMDVKAEGEMAYAKVNELLKQRGVNYVVLAGYLPIIPDSFCNAWKNKMVNIHPSLLPAYGGKGMYGDRVQEAVMAAKEKYCGCSVHFVSEVIDGGDIIMQRSLEVDYSMTPQQMGEKIRVVERELLPEAVGFLVNH